MRRLLPIFVASVTLHACTNKAGDSADSEVTNTAPECGFTAPEPNAFGEEGTTVPFQGTTTDSETPAQELAVTLTSDLDGDLGEVEVSADGIWYLTTPSLTVGTHQVSVESVDGDGAACTADTLYTVGNPPTVEITLPEQDAALGDYAAVAFEAIVLDDQDAPQDLIVVWEHPDLGILDETPADADGIA